MSFGSSRDKRIRVAVLGATGSVGQRFVALLANHPWFEIGALAASERSAGRPYGEAAAWAQSTPLPPAIASQLMRAADPKDVGDCPLVFSALDAAVAGPLEEAFARDGRLVVSNSKNHRMDARVPLLVPEVNAEHIDLARHQSFGPGAILTNPNCSTIGLVLALKPLADAFGVTAAHVVTMQALSGAGLPGVSSMQAIDNIIPYIPEEEEKIEREAHKILGRLAGDHIEPHAIRISAQCNRVPVIDGHTACVSISLERKAAIEDVRDAWRDFSAEPQRLRLPSAPIPAIHYLDEPDAPQPRLHRELGSGMAAAVGRLRPCSLLDYKFVTLSHNTLRGAAGGALLVAELACEKGLLPAQ